MSGTPIRDIIKDAIATLDRGIKEIESPYSPKYQRLFAKVLLCQTGFDKQDLDDIVSIVFSDFKDNENNY